MEKSVRRATCLGDGGSGCHGISESLLCAQPTRKRMGIFTRDPQTRFAGMNNYLVHPSYLGYPVGTVYVRSGVRL
jgi:hypothetical protein